MSDTENKAASPFGDLIGDALGLSAGSKRGFSLMLETGEGKDSRRKTLRMDPVADGEAPGCEFRVSHGVQPKAALHCSFCAKSQHEVRKLIAGPSVFICDECIELCNGILGSDAAQLAGA